MPNNPARKYAKSFIKRIQYRLPVASVSKTSTAAFRSKFGIRRQYKSTQSKELIGESGWPKLKSKSVQLKKTSESKPNIRTRIRTSAAVKDATTTRQSLTTR